MFQFSILMRFDGEIAQSSPASQNFNQQGVINIDVASHDYQIKVTYDW